MSTDMWLYIASVFSLPGSRIPQIAQSLHSTDRNGKHSFGLKWLEATQWC